MDALFFLPLVAKHIATEIEYNYPKIYETGFVQVLSKTKENFIDRDFTNYLNKMLGDKEPLYRANFELIHLC